MWRLAACNHRDKCRGARSSCVSLHLDLYCTLRKLRNAAGRTIVKSATSRTSAVFFNRSSATFASLEIVERSHLLITMVCGGKK